MRKPKANCVQCGWHAIAATEALVVEEAFHHQNAVGHTIRVMVPEGWFGWGSYDMYPMLHITEREKDARERLAESWNPPRRYNGD